MIPLNLTDNTKKNVRHSRALLTKSKVYNRISYYIYLPSLLGRALGLNPSQTRSLISSPAFRRMLTASWCVAPRRDWPFTSMIL